ncbi:MAG TPA: hypothetical protein VIL86_20085 [Tepidisphaeraceae bacterium]
MSQSPDSSTTLPPLLDTPQGTLAKTAGGIGIASVLIGLALFMGACAGFNAVFAFSLIPLFAGAAGFVLTIVAGSQKNTGVQDMGIVAALFLNIMGFVGGLLMTATWLHWHIFFTTGG